jgi:hypothetical protein
MKRFIPRGRPKVLKHPRQFLISFEEDMLEEFDQYCLEIELSRNETLRQVTRHVIDQRKEEKEQLEQQEKDKSVSCLSHKLVEDEDANTNEFRINNNNGRQPTKTGENMESVFKLVNQIESMLDTLPDRQLKTSLKLTLKPFKERINQQSGIEYKKAAGLYRVPTLLLTKTSSDEYWKEKLSTLHSNNQQQQQQAAEEKGITS